MIIQIGVYIVCLIIFTSVRIKAFLKKQKIREVCVYSGLMAICGVLGSLFIAEIELPSLVVPYEIVFQPIGKMILKK